MKHYILLIAAITTPAYAQVAETTTAQIENAAQTIQLPPSTAQDLRQMNTTNEISAAVPPVSQAPTTTTQVTTNRSAASASPTTTNIVPTVRMATIQAANSAAPAITKLASTAQTNALNTPPVTAKIDEVQNTGNGANPNTITNSMQTQPTTTSVDVGVPAVTLPNDTSRTSELGMAMPTGSQASSAQQTAPQSESVATQNTTTAPQATAAAHTEKASDPTLIANVPAEGPNLTEQILMAFGGVFVIAFIGLTLVRLKKKGALGFGKNDRAQMEIISQFTLSPKRKIIVVRIRDQELALASTEHGITMLTELAAPKPQRSMASAIEPKLVGTARNENSSRSVAPQDNSENAQAKKSESFLNALKNIKNKAAQQNEERSQNAANNVSHPSEQAPTPKSSPTLGQTRAAFPKYLANAFQQEGNRKVKGAGSAEGTGDEENLENVTNMIRQKLKNIHQAG